MTSYTAMSCFTLLLAAFLFAVSGCEGNREGVLYTSPDSSIQKMLQQISPDSIEANIRTLVAFKTRHTMSDTSSDSVGIGAARRWIFSKFKQYSNRSGKRLNVSYTGYTETENRRINRPTRIVDVVAELPGTGEFAKNRVLVVSGHYDSRVSDVMNDSSFAPGANDDASGTAAVLELARVMSKHDYDATIIFLAVAGEEQGLLGSTHYAKQAKAAGTNIIAMLNNDIIGSSTAEDGSVHNNVVRVFAQGVPPDKELSNYYRMLLFTGGGNDTPARELGRFIYEIGQSYVKNFEVNLIYRKDRYLRSGDHVPFLAEGYPAVRFTEPHENFKHQHQRVRIEDGVEYGDLPKFVDFDYVANVARINAATLATLANAPAIPQKVGLEVQKLDNNTTLQWEASNEPDLKGYEIVWRATHAPYWQYSKFVGNVSRYTIEDVSKDNYLFGVRSVDKQGNKSTAVYPLPIRNE